MLTQNKRLISIMLTAALLLLLPLIAMQFSDEVNWTGNDFLAMGILLLGAGLIFELIMRRVKQTHNRIILSIVLFVALFLVWAELAVGIFGTPFAGS